LGQKNESTSGDPTETEFDSVDDLFPNRSPEPNAKFVDVKTTPPGCQKVAQLVDDNKEVKDENDLENDEGDT